MGLVDLSSRHSINRVNVYIGKRTDEHSISYRDTWLHPDGVGVIFAAQARNDCTKHNRDRKSLSIIVGTEEKP